MTLAEIAEKIGARVHGNPSKVIEGLATLGSANPHQLSFFVNPRYLTALKATSAGAVLVKAEHLSDAPCDALVCDNPYMSFAELTALFVDVPEVGDGVHPSAVVDSSAVLEGDVKIGPRAVIGANVVIGKGSVIHPGVVVEANCQLGSECILYANVTLYHGVTLGDRVTLHSGCVIGADGFGFAPSAHGWVKIHQLGGVFIDDDVEIGANTTVDRGALDDTRIGRGVIIDNQVHIAHNVTIGEGTAIAAKVGIAGSCNIGKRNMIGGMVGIVDHINTADDVIISATSTVNKDLKEPGTYTGIMPISKHSEWKRIALWITKLDKISKFINFKNI